MANNYFWRGSAAAVAQVDTLTVGGTVEADDIFIITMTDEKGETEVLSVVAGSTTKTAVATTIAAAFNASTHYMFTPITALAVGETVTLTADTAGVPFYAAATTTETGGGGADDQTFIRAATTANSGPYDWNTQANWFDDEGDNDLPGSEAADTVYVEGDSAGNATIKYGLDQDAITVLTALNITRAQVGENGQDGRPPTYLRILATTVNINYPCGPGTPRHSAPVNVDVTTTASTINIYDSGTNNPTTEPAVNILANEATTDIYIKKGIVGIASHAGETGAIDILNVSFVSNRTGDAKVYIGAGLTQDELVMSGGLVEISNSITTKVEVTGGILDTTKSKSAITLPYVKLDPSGIYKHNIDKVTLTAAIEPVKTTGNVTYAAS